MPPETSPPQETSPRRFPHSWMRVDDTSFVSQVSRSPVRSTLFQESVKSLSSQNLTQGQLVRWKIAETVRLVNFKNTINA